MKYIINKKQLIKTIKAFRINAKIYYPLKVNTDKTLLEIIDPFIRGYEVESYYQAVMLIMEMKVDPKRILFSSPLLTNARTIDKLLSLQIVNYAVDDVTICKSIIQRGTGLGLKFLLRLDINKVVETDNIQLKWGASLNDICHMAKQIEESGYTFLGVSYYLPQEVASLENHIKVLNYIAKNIKDIKYLDIGGGIKPSDVKSIKKTVESSFNEVPVILVEPGRHLLNPSIDLVVKIVSIRKKQEKKLLFIDCGIYSGLIDCIVKKRSFKIKALSENNNKFTDYLVCGDTSDISDIIGVYSLPFDLRIGDELIIKECGAYCSEMDTNFCENKRANYIIVDS
ncbi:MAG: hypothetical protein IJV48_02375 [Ruminococcus sp.]|nr:hypothetical protein [Ruminococcus sp.]